MTFTFKCVGCSHSFVSPRETPGSCPHCGCDGPALVGHQDGDVTLNGSKFGYLTSTGPRQTKGTKQKKSPF